MSTHSLSGKISSIPATTLNGSFPTEVGVANGVELKENVGGANVGDEIADIARVAIAGIRVGVTGARVGVTRVVSVVHAVNRIMKINREQGIFFILPSFLPPINSNQLHR